MILVLTGKMLRREDVGLLWIEVAVMGLFRVVMRQMVLPSSLEWQGKVRWEVAVGAVQFHDISTRDSLIEQTFSRLERSSSNNSDHK